MQVKTSGSIIGCLFLSLTTILKHITNYTSVDYHSTAEVGSCRMNYLTYLQMLDREWVGV